MIYQLNYRSTAIPNLQVQGLNDILEKAKTYNSTRNISGCLVYHNNCFVQILEGEKKDVLQLYKKIEADPRHHSISVMWEANVENKYFADWNMAFYRPDDENMVQFVNNMLLLSQLSDKSSGSLLSFWGNVHRILKNEESKDIYETL